MTDKEIIIDGVDVSECEHQYYKKCKIDYDEWINEIICYNECQNNPNCHFKQLKRKEQECDKYKQALGEIEEYLDVQQKYLDGEDYHNLLDIINKVKE